MFMISKTFGISGIICSLFVLSSCAGMVATQNVPVSTNPSGAQVIVDGDPSCVTPCSVVLARTQDHLLTFQKAGYRQQDVTVRRQHQTEMELLQAINSGVNGAKFFKSSAAGLNSAVQSLSARQATGDAYTLVPPTIAVTLAPAAGFPRQSTMEEAEQSLGKGISPLELMDNSDEHMLETALEKSATGEVAAWKNARSGLSFAVEPEDARNMNGHIRRYFKVGVSKGGDKVTARYDAYRVGQGEWVEGEPRDNGSSGAGRVLAQSLSPEVHKEWKVKESSSSSVQHNADGSITTKSRSSSTKAGVSVGPGAIFGILDALKSAEDSR